MIAYKGEGLMIRFYCEHCAHKISVQDKDVGKQGKCQKCGGVIVVPTESTVIDFLCEYCDRKISVLKINAGKKAVCPKCNHTFIIPAIQSLDSAAKQNHAGDLIACSTDSPHDLILMDVPDEYKLKEEPAVQSNVSEKAIERQQESEETEPAGHCRLPWFIDIFLYPLNLAGVVHLIGLWLLF